MPEVQTPEIDHGILEKVLLSGDLSKLSNQERLTYILRVCDSLGLNAYTQPFRYLTFQGKMVLYATKDCAEQLRKLYRVGVTFAESKVTEGVFVVTAVANMPDGRLDSSMGAMPIEGLKGNDRANAIMKAETKAKRRVTLSICGLGMMDESEVSSVPGARIVDDEASKILTEAGSVADAGTKQAAQDVAAHKIAQLKAQAAVASKPIVQPPPKIIEPESNSVADFEEAVAKRAFTALKGFDKLKAFAEVKAELKKLCDPAAGEAEYYRILKTHKVEHANDFKTTLPAWNCYWELRRLVKSLIESLTAEPEVWEATDADLPDNLK